MRHAVADDQQRLPRFAGLRACVAADEHAAQVDGGCARRVHHDQRVAAVFVSAAAANLAVYADGNRVADGDDLHARAACRAPAAANAARDGDEGVSAQAEQVQPRAAHHRVVAAANGSGEHHRAVFAQRGNLHAAAAAFAAANAALDADIQIAAALADGNTRRALAAGDFAIPVDQQRAAADQRQAALTRCALNADGAQLDVGYAGNRQGIPQLHIGEDDGGVADVQPMQNGLAVAGDLQQRGGGDGLLRRGHFAGDEQNVAVLRAAHHVQQLLVIERGAERTGAGQRRAEKNSQQEQDKSPCCFHGTTSFQMLTTIIEQKANVAQSAGAQCAPLRARRRNVQFLFSATL